MAPRANDIREKINSLLHRAVDQIGRQIGRQTNRQLDDVKATLLKSAKRIDFDLNLEWVRRERGRLLHKLGQQTRRLASQTRLPLPTAVRRQVERLSELLTEATVTQPRTSARSVGAEADARAKQPGDTSAAREMTVGAATRKSRAAGARDGTTRARTSHPTTMASATSQHAAADVSEGRATSAATAEKRRTTHKKTTKKKAAARRPVATAPRLALRGRHGGRSI